MSERERADIELGILSIGREWDKQACQCDPDVGMVPCHYCAEHAAILAGERLLNELAAARAALRPIVAEWDRMNGRLQSNRPVHEITIRREVIEAARAAGGER